jgi:hypothetical protein
MAGLIWVQWYATILRGDLFADAVSEQAAPITLRYGANHYSVHRSRDDRYKITQMAWFDRKEDWYLYWEGPEMVEFRSRYAGKYQVPIAYGWQDEIAYGALEPEYVTNGPEPTNGPHPVAPRAAL